MTILVLKHFICDAGLNFILQQLYLFYCNLQLNNQILRRASISQKAAADKCFRQVVDFDKSTNSNSVYLQVEVFNILFIREQEKRHVVHCMDCARKQSPSLEGFVTLEEYKMSDLCQVYDHFQLHPVVSTDFQLVV